MNSQPNNPGALLVAGLFVFVGAFVVFRIVLPFAMDLIETALGLRKR